MNVRKHMSAPPITIGDDADFNSALGLMQRHRIRRLPVVDANGTLVGIVAERNLLVAADRFLTAPVEVGRIMTRQVVTVGATAPLVDAATLMIERKIGGLPVVDSSRKLLGIITETDLLKALAAMLRRVQRGAQASKTRHLTAWPKKSAPIARSTTRRAAAKRPKTVPKNAPPKGGRLQTSAARKVSKRAGSR
jgi:CBS-domain-containing membrane protein